MGFQKALLAAGLSIALPLFAGRARGADDKDLPPSQPVPTTRSTEPATTPAAPEEHPTSILQWPALTGDWFGVRNTLLDHGIEFDGYLTADDTKNLVGQNTRSAASRSLLDLSLTLDTDKLAHLQGGSFFVEFQNENGQIAQQLVGTAQPLAVIDADGRTELDQLWYQQLLFDDKLRIKVGKIDANVDFALPQFSTSFLSGAFNFSPAIVGFPTYPDPATAFTAFVSPTENLTIGAGIFDGSTLMGNPTGPRGPATFGRASSGFFLIGQIDLSWTLPQSRTGHLELGVYDHTGHIARFDGMTQSGAAGPYLVVEQTLWRKNPDQKDDNQGIGIFSQYAWADPHISVFQEHASIGLQWIGPLATRGQDILGFGISWVQFTGAAAAGFPHPSETLTELYYRVQVTPWVTIQPDLQYIHTPSGRSQDALAATVQAVLKI